MLDKPQIVQTDAQPKVAFCSRLGARDLGSSWTCACGVATTIQSGACTWCDYHVCNACRAIR